MKVVIFIDWFAPAYKAGGPIQSIVNLVGQPLEGVEYKIICSNKDLDGTVLFVKLDEWVRYNQFTEVWYSSNNRNLYKPLRQISKWKPDVFFINGIYSLFYNLLPILLGKATRKIISTRGMLHTGALSQKSVKKKLYLTLWKFLGIHKKHSFHATNAEEENFIKTIFGSNAKVFIAANLPRVLQLSQTYSKEKNALELISIGLISPMKNYLEVLKALKTCTDKINYSIYGPIKDATYWEQCKTIIENLPSNISVRYAGDLPSAKVAEALSTAHVFILPSKSENFGHAIYEALTAGKPVITSYNTPWNGLEEAHAGLNVSPQNDYELSKAICFFAAADAAELASWSIGARDYAAKAIDLNKIQNQYRQMFQF